jgi:hypothetical protein
MCVGDARKLLQFAAQTKHSAGTLRPRACTDQFLASRVIPVTAVIGFWYQDHGADTVDFQEREIPLNTRSKIENLVMRRICQQY